jgi:hypothetical protein
MTCACIDYEGNPKDVCTGLCNQTKYAQLDGVKMREEHSSSDKIEYILSMFLSKLDIKIERLEHMVHEQYKKGVIDGFNMARDAL